MRPGNFCGAPMTRVTFLTLSLFPTFDRADVFRENNTRGDVESSSLRDIECTRRTSRFLKFGHCRNFCGMYVRTRRQSFACRDLLIATIIAIFTITIPSFFFSHCVRRYTHTYSTTDHVVCICNASAAAFIQRPYHVILSSVRIENVKRDRDDETRRRFRRKSTTRRLRKRLDCRS